MLHFLFVSMCFSGDPIKDIRAEYSSIRTQIENFSIDSLNIMGQSSEGGIAYIYKNRLGQSRLIISKFYGELGKIESEYYIKNDSLFFMFSQNFNYNAPFFMTTQNYANEGFELFDPDKTSIHENRYYFENDKLIRWINQDKKFVDSGSEDFNKKEKAVLELFHELVDLINH